MLFQIIRFELKYWLKQPMVYVFLLINALLIFGATSSENITVGSAIGNVHKNAPFVVESFFASMSLICLVMVTAFVNVAAARDFFYNSHQIIYSTPLRKFDFLVGRFIGAAIVSMIPFLGISIGNIVGSMMPWLDESRIGPTNWNAHLQGFVVFIIPNVLFSASFVFCVAALTRSTITSFLCSILFLVAYGIAQGLIRDIEQESIGVLLDPLGARTFDVATKYWTVDDRNNQVLGLTGIVLTNRLIWLGVGLIIFIVTYFRFSFTEKKKASKKKVVDDETSEMKGFSHPLPAAATSYSSSVSFRQFLHQSRIDFLGVVKSTPFIVILLAGILNMVISLIYVRESFYGGTSFPVTYNVIDSIKGTLYVFLVAIIAFYSGVLVWKERDAKHDEIHDTLPHQNWITSLAKLAAMTLVVEVILLVAVLTGIIIQTIFGYTNYKIGQYLVELVILDGFFFFYLTVLSMLIHTLINHKYLAYFLFIIVAIVNLIIWPALNIGSNMVIFGGRPSATYSDMNAFGPYIPGLTWFNIYWLLFASLLIIATLFFWVRGKERSFSFRWKNGLRSFSLSKKLTLLGFMILWLVTAGFVYYNTKVINQFDAPKTAEEIQSDYEKKYKQYENAVQPYIVDIRHHIDLFPEDRRLHVEGTWIMKNISMESIDSLYFTIPPGMKMEISIPGSQLVYSDEDLYFRIYRLEKTMMPGESFTLNFITDYDAKGFENQVSRTEIVQNGSFFNNTNISPNLGYQTDGELLDKNKRRKYGLKEKQRRPFLERDCNKNCMNSYVGGYAHWVNEETIISTSADQIAVAPGSLVKEWKEGNRQYYHYKLDHPSLNFYSFISASFEVARDKWKTTVVKDSVPVNTTVDLEVYYVKEHEFNVQKMLNAMKASLTYFSENFGPYYQKQARIIEFPRYASFAQAFAGTMPYSESIGFIANLEDSDDIDMVTYVVAHEMGHQWWAHQVIGANMQGATMLSESMAQYSALMVMKHMYGEEQMHKFLKYEMDRYLRRRGGEILKEVPLLKVEDQGYIHYNKGSVAMYYLQEMIGEENVNKALREMIDSFAYREPPYPTSYHLTDAFARHTPDSLQYLIRDLFYDITLFNNQTQEATYRDLKNGTYEVTLKVKSQKFKADSLGKETQVPENDWIEIGAYAKPAEGKKYGKQLYSKLEKISSDEHTFIFITNEKPDKAGIDPNYYLVDRIPDDNVKSVEEKN